MVIDQIIQQLCVTAGSIMEDASVAAVTRPPANAEDRRSSFVALKRAGKDIAALLVAAEVLARRCEGKSKSAE